MSFGVHYLAPAALRELTTASPSSIVGGFSFDCGRPPGLPADCPFAEIAMPRLAGSGCYEVWTAAVKPSFELSGPIAASRAGEFIFGILELAEPARSRLEETIYGAYAEILDFLDRRSCGVLLRTWHYLPAITAKADGMERYHAFSLGRWRAFRDRRPGALAPAAASALGIRQGSVVIAFIGASSAGQPLENPRQVSAYHYPPQYGPQSPTFSRAMLAAIAGEQLLFVSGTASIVGHESRHPGDPAAQTDEIVRNFQALLAEAGKHGFHPARDSARLKVYLRDPADLGIVKGRLAEALPAAGHLLYLQAEICRFDLDVEIEAFFKSRDS